MKVNPLLLGIFYIYLQLKGPVCYQQNLAKSISKHFTPLFTKCCLVALAVLLQLPHNIHKSFQIAFFYTFPEHFHPMGTIHSLPMVTLFTLKELNFVFLNFLQWNSVSHMSQDKPPHILSLLSHDQVFYLFYSTKIWAEIWATFGQFWPILVLLEPQTLRRLANIKRRLFTILCPKNLCFGFRRNFISNKKLCLQHHATFWGL